MATKKIKKGLYEHTAPDGSVWTIRNWGYGRGWGSVRWVAASPNHRNVVRRSKSECIHVIDIEYADGGEA